LCAAKGCNHILCRSEQRIEKDKAIREKHEQRLIADLEKLSKRIAGGKLTEAKKIDIMPSSREPCFLHCQ